MSIHPSLRNNQFSAIQRKGRKRTHPGQKAASERKKLNQAEAKAVLLSKSQASGLPPHIIKFQEFKKTKEKLTGFIPEYTTTSTRSYSSSSWW
jgi:hypothetical protein